MGNLTSALQQLRAERRVAQLQVEIRSSDISDRVAKRFGGIPESQSTDPSNIASFAAQDGTGAKGEMGEGSEGNEANGAGENNGRGTCEAHHVSIGPQENRGVSAGEVGKGEGAAKESGVASQMSSRRGGRSDYVVGG